MIPDKPIYITGNELPYIGDAIANDQLSGSNAPFRQKCEEWLECELGHTKALLVNSGTAALEMAVRLCCIQPGDEVIMPSFTFTSTATAVALAGGAPVFVDIQPDTMNICPDNIRAAITPKTRAIIPVHYAGYPCDMDAIMQIALDNNLFVIEDAAQALLSSYHGKKLGTIGHFGCLSFHESKNIQCGEGGALLVNDVSYLERAEILREKGTNREQFSRNMVKKYTWVDIGSSYILSNLQSAFLFAQLEKAHWITERRIAHHALYHSLLQPLAEKGKLAISAHENPYPGNGHIFHIITKSPAQKENLQTFLKERDILVFSHYVPLHSSPYGKKSGRKSDSLAITEELADCLLRLPIYPHITVEQIQKVVAAIDKFYSKN